MEYIPVHIHNSSIKKSSLAFFVIPSIVFVLVIYIFFTLLNNNQNTQISKVENTNTAVLGEDTETPQK